ncbi:LysR family transcriptional regulator [Spartinivicinus ruber]|uniref:LysR family transcriptional regulator n=1 Tax=Spartinivicinus ruber TaxID=2683272 RepID=UPI0013D053D7|nr:LysR family transcriptional regulator [Spartinivicinus ruber]
MPNHLPVNLMDMLNLAKIIQQDGFAVGSNLSEKNSAVVEAIELLEKSLNLQLHEPGSTTLQLTAVGERVLESSQRILAELEGLEQHLAHQPNNLIGNISVSAPADIGRQCICLLLEQFSNKHPEVSVELLVNDPIGNINWSNVDLIICIGPQSDSRLKALKVAPNQQIICAAPAYIESHGNPQTPYDLLNHQCLVLNHMQYWRFSLADNIFEIPITGYRHTNDGEILRQWAVAGAGIVMKSIWEVQTDITTKRLVPLLTEYTIPVGALYVVYPRQQMLPERCRRLIHFIQEQLAEQAKHLYLLT